MQGRLWHDVLRRRGVPARLLVYPEDEHSLASVECDLDLTIQAALWFAQYAA